MTSSLCTGFASDSAKFFSFLVACKIMIRHWKRKLLSYLEYSFGEHLLCPSQIIRIRLNYFISVLHTFLQLRDQFFPLAILGTLRRNNTENRRENISLIRTSCFIRSNFCSKRTISSMSFSLEPLLDRSLSSMNSRIYKASKNEERERTSVHTCLLIAVMSCEHSWAHSARERSSSFAISCFRLSASAADAILQAQT